MAKKGFFSWFRKDKPQEEVVAEAVSEVPAEQVDGETNTEQVEQIAEAQLDELAPDQIVDEASELVSAAEIDTADAVVEEKALVSGVAVDAAAEALPKPQTEQTSADEDDFAVNVAVETKYETDVTVVEDEDDEDEAVVVAGTDVITTEAEAIDPESVTSENKDLDVADTIELPADSNNTAGSDVEAEETTATEFEETQPEPQERPNKEGFFARLRRGLLRTSENIGSGFFGLFKGKKIDDDLFEELEEQLLIADVGVETTSRLIKSLTDHASRKQLKDAESLYDLLREEMQKTIEPVSIPLIPDNENGPFVILMVGVNGVGKTTTIGKLAKQYQAQGKSVMLAAGDTFRAAAVEQLQVWGQRNEIPVIAQHTGADSASVLFDALQAAKARNVDVLIADTAGRLQNKAHLMEELKKVVRVMKKQDETAPHEVMLTLDASTGQNAISQAQLFQQAVGVTGITITKLDGTAKGGVIFAIADKFGIPIRHIGVGEQIDDLREFEAKGFIDALFSQEK